MRISVVVASKDRPELLSRLLQTLEPQLLALGEEAELIVVDDGSTVPYDPATLSGAVVLRTRGVGPARARNAGTAVARGEIVAYVDDDVIVAANWVAVALGYLDAHRGAAGVTGATSSPAYNAVYEHSVSDLVGGSFLTCNIAYRRAALVDVGGFDRLFSHAHEDRDLAWRVMEHVGDVDFEPAMCVTHPGRPFGVRAAWRRAHFIYDDWLLFQRYPERRLGTCSVRWTPCWNTARTWRNVALAQRLWRSPQQWPRFVVVAGGQFALSVWLASTRWRHLKDRDTRAVPGLRHDQRRVAYVGPSPAPRAGGAPGVAGLLLDQLLARGFSIDCFVAASREDDDPRALGTRDALSFVIGRSRFAFGRWYSRSRLTKMLSLQVFAALTRRRLARTLRALNDASPYDVIYQFSTFESFGVPRRRARTALVIHPSVHAAGEKNWTRQEVPLRMSNDGALRRGVLLAWLSLRAARQRRDAQRATGIFALSAQFAREIERDYAISASRIAVVPNCIDVASLSRGEPANLHLVVAGRLAVRKGLEDVVALSERLATLRPTPQLRVIGAPSLWSDYRTGLARADTSTTTLVGGRTREEVFAEMSGSLALVQLSRYEPFGLTVAEALAVGVPVIVTPAVGAAESLAADVKIVIEPGDIDALVGAVVSLCALRDDERQLLSFRCRSEAERLFRPEVVTDQLVAALNSLLD